MIYRSNPKRLPKEEVKREDRLEKRKKSHESYLKKLEKNKLKSKK